MGGGGGGGVKNCVFQITCNFKLKNIFILLNFLGIMEEQGNLLNMLEKLSVWGKQSGTV